MYVLWMQESSRHTPKNKRDTCETHSHLINLRWDFCGLERRDSAEEDITNFTHNSTHPPYLHEFKSHTQDDGSYTNIVKQHKICGDNIVT